MSHEHNDVEQRVCRSCDWRRPIGDFPFTGRGNAYRRRTCTACTYARRGHIVCLDKFKSCRTCGMTKRRTEFWRNGGSLDGVLSRCKGCTAEVQRKKYADATLKMRERKVALGCVDCGYKDDPAKLEWDHLPGYEKVFQIGRNIHRSAAVVEAEIAKCELVCRPCHIRRSIERGQFSTRGKG